MRDLKPESIQPEANVRAPQHPFIQNFFDLNLYSIIDYFECMCCVRVTQQVEGAPSGEQLERQRRQQVELIAKLKAQLTDLESFAYQVRSPLLLMCMSVLTRNPYCALSNRQRLPIFSSFD